MKRAVCLVFLCLALLLTGLSGCAPSAPVESAPSPTPQAEHYYALVVKDVTNPYTVSYTHLDVYKRQEQMCAQWRFYDKYRSIREQTVT